MSYIDTRNFDLRQLHSVYSKDISDFVCNLADLKELQRLSNISKNNGVELSKFNSFQFDYSRLDHSFGVAIILENFKVSKEHIVEAMFHEIAEPSFAFSAKYLIDYFKMTDFIAPTIYDKMVESDYLFDKSFNNDFSIKDISNCKNYSLGFADFPKLCAETLEYIMANGYFTKTCDIRELQDLFNSIIILHNEEDKEEFGFTDIYSAKNFFKLSLEIGKKKRSYEAKITKQLISDVLMLMMRREEIGLMDLYNYSDKALIEVGKSCSDKRIQEGWEQVENLDQVYTKFNPTYDSTKYCVKVPEESIYINPLVKTKAGTFRLTDVDEACEKELETYLATDTDLYMYIDYEL